MEGKEEHGYIGKHEEHILLQEHTEASKRIGDLGDYEEEEEEKRRRFEWEFKSVNVSSSDTDILGSLRSRSTDFIGTMAFDESSQWLATGGMARKIRIYSFDKTLLNMDQMICTPAKLSSIRYDPTTSNVVGCGDYDGVVTEWDVERGAGISERDEHGGRRVWSIDYSHLFHNMCSSSSDDGTVQIWDRSSPGTVMVIPSPSLRAVCCAEFGDYLIAMACSDSGVYVQDIRKVISHGGGGDGVSTLPFLYSFKGHTRPASYVRFVDDGMLASSAIDGSIMLWNIASGSEDPVRTFRGHKNQRNFVGLSVWSPGGLFACGSESNEVFVYDYRWSTPVWTHELCSSENGDLCFVSGVCWREKPNECTLVAANSLGMLQVIVGERRA